VEGQIAAVVVVSAGLVKWTIAGSVPIAINLNYSTVMLSEQVINYLTYACVQMYATCTGHVIGNDMVSVGNHVIFNCPTEWV